MQALSSKTAFVAPCKASAARAQRRTAVVVRAQAEQVRVQRSWRPHGRDGAPRSAGYRGLSAAARWRSQPAAASERAGMSSVRPIASCCLAGRPPCCPGPAGRRRRCECRRPLGGCLRRCRPRLRRQDHQQVRCGGRGSWVATLRHRQRWAPARCGCPGRGPGAAKSNSQVKRQLLAATLSPPPPHRLCALRRRWLCAAAALQVEPQPPEGVPWHRAAVRGGGKGGGGGAA